MTESYGVAEVCAVIYSQPDGGAIRLFQLSVSTENSTTGCSHTLFPFPTLFIIMYNYMYVMVRLEDTTSDFIS